MKETNYIEKKRLVFKRWSRKSYAVFVSLKKEISIGRLTKSIVEKSLIKGKPLQKNALRLFVQKLNLFVEKEEDIDILTQQIFGLGVDNYVYLLPIKQETGSKNIKHNNYYHNSGCSEMNVTA